MTERQTPDAGAEVTVPPTDPAAETRRRDVDDPAGAAADPATLRDGGPTTSPGAMTTTGGTAGPASVHRRTNRERTGVEPGPTTTGDATTGGFDSPAAGSTSDASTGRGAVGDFTDDDR
jgi:hypothetical protein